MIETGLVATAVVLALLLFPGLYRAYTGPTSADRLIAINVISTKVIVLISLAAAITDNAMFVDVAFIYALIGFIATIAVARLIETGRLD
ncbi:MAG: monovalent cation/H+ antiporter complex subunit F [Spirochaetota bacterium]